MLDYRLVLILFLTFLSTEELKAQRMTKSFQTVKVQTVIQAPAEEVWQTMVIDYGEIANFSPFIYSSDYQNGSLKGEVGAERKCNFNEGGTKWVHERIASLNHETYTAQNHVIDGRKLPLDFNNSQGVYQIIDNGDGSSTATYEFQYRTKPAFLGMIIKSGFRKQMGATLIGLKHYIETGEKVTPTNKRYQDIKGDYPAAAIIK